MPAGGRGGVNRELACTFPSVQRSESESPSPGRCKTQQKGSCELKAASNVAERSKTFACYWVVYSALLRRGFKTGQEWAVSKLQNAVSMTKHPQFSHNHSWAEHQKDVRSPKNIWFYLCSFVFIGVNEFDSHGGKKSTIITFHILNCFATLVPEEDFH